jgi:hypothetical protein
MDYVAAVNVRSNSALVVGPRSPDVIRWDSRNLEKLDDFLLIEE